MEPDCGMLCNEAVDYSTGLGREKLGVAMHGLPSPAMGRAMLLFAVLIGGLGLYILATREWLQGGFWLAVGVFVGCYGLVLRERHARWDRWVLGVGLAAGVIAFALAIALT